MSVSPSVSAVMSAAVLSACMTAQGLALPAILWASTRERGAMAPKSARNWGRRAGALAPTSARKTAGSWSGPAAAPAWAYKKAAARAGRSGTGSVPASDGTMAAARRTADSSHTSARPTGFASSALPYLVAASRKSEPLKGASSGNTASATEVQ